MIFIYINFNFFIEDKIGRIGIGRMEANISCLATYKRLKKLVNKIILNFAGKMSFCHDFEINRFMIISQ